MDTVTRINELLGRLDVAATRLTDQEHPEVVVQLDANAGEAGMEGIVDCTVTTAQVTPEYYAVTLTPTRRHCRQCGTIFTPPHDAQALICPDCAAVQAEDALPPA